MLTFNFEEMEKYRTIIANQFNQIQTLEKLARSLDNMNKVKYESFRQQMKSEMENDIKKLTSLKDDIENKKNKLLDDVKNFNIESQNKFKCIDYLLKKNNVECPICYEQITIKNLYNPGCHMEHIHCLDCSKLIDKCSLCKVQKNNGNAMLSNFELNVQEHSNLVSSLALMFIGDSNNDNNGLLTDDDDESDEENE